MHAPRRATAADQAATAACRDDYRDYHELLADPAIEAVSIVTHVDDHVEPAMAALRAGQARARSKSRWRATRGRVRPIIAAAEKADRILMVGHICRFNPALRSRPRADRRRRDLGRIVSMYARRNIPAARSASVLDKIGPLLGDGIHDTDLMLWMSGDRIEIGLRPDASASAG